jgi:hypothetical protein
MLIFFPKPYPDEDFRSIVYRFSKLSANSNKKDVMYELFQAKTVRNKLILPRNMLNLLNEIPGQHTYSLKRMVKEHSYLPLMKPFYSLTEYNRIVEDIGQTTGAIVVGTNRLRHMLSNQVRYCPLCLLADYQTIGETYVHRIHQIKFVQVCPHHNVYLISSCSECQRSFSYDKELLTTPFCSNQHYLPSYAKQIKPADTEDTLLYRVATNTNYLLQNDKDISIDLLRENYRDHALKQGYFSPNGLTIKNTNFIRDFLVFFPFRQLETLGITVNHINRKFAQIYFNLQGNHYNVLVHILIMMYFSGSVNNFLNQMILNTEPFIPFGYGPWECLNELCTEFNQPSINLCNRYSYKEVIYGSFRCEKCGYTYTKKCNRETLQTLEKIYVRDKGWVWDKKEFEIHNLYAVEIKQAQRFIKRQRILVEKIHIPKKQSFAWTKLLFQVYLRVRSYKETARILGTTEITVKKILTKNQRKIS